MDELIPTFHMVFGFPGVLGNRNMEDNSDLDDEGSGLELVHVSDVLDYLGEYGKLFNNKSQV